MFKKYIDIKSPQCTADLTPSVCSVFNSPITTAVVSDEGLQAQALLTSLGTFISCVDRKSKDNYPKTYTEIYWSGDSMPMALVYPLASSTSSTPSTSPSPASVAVLVRGTLTIKDIIEDMDYSQVEFNGALVHKGFNDVYQEIKASLGAAIASYSTTGSAIYIAGHSLGAAVVQLYCAENITSTSNINAYLIGSPRVGNSAFNKLLTNVVETNQTNNIDNMLNLADVITSLPSTYSEKRGHLYQYEPMPAFMAMSNASTDPVSCHSMINYYNTFLQLNSKI
jgi:hypothetical protein